MLALEVRRRGRSSRTAAATAILLAVLGLVAGMTPAPTRAAISLGLAAYKTGFAKPVALANAGDGTGRLFVVEQEGRVRIITKAGSLSSTPFLDIHARVSCCGEQGLAGS